MACKEINVGGHRGWRLRIIEAFIIILTFTELLYVMLVHAGLYSSRYGPGYRDTDYGMGTHPTETGVKGTSAMGTTRVWCGFFYYVTKKNKHVMGCWCCWGLIFDVILLFVNILISECMLLYNQQVFCFQFQTIYYTMIWKYQSMCLLLLR